MADIILNIAKGRFNELQNRVDANDPAASAIVLVLLKTTELDAVLLDYDNLSALLGVSNVEANFTNYARKTLTDVDVLASVVDDVNNRREADLPDQTWVNSGNGINNTLAKLLICYDSDTGVGTDANIEVMAALDFVITTNGGDITAQFNVAGWARAA